MSESNEELITAEELEEIENEGLQEFNKEYESIDGRLRMSAQTVLNNYNYVESAVIAYKEQAQHVEKIKDKKEQGNLEAARILRKQMWGELKKIENILKLFMENALRFQLLVNEALGQTVKMIWEFDGKLYEVDENIALKYFHIDQASKGGGLIFRYDNLSSLLTADKEIGFSQQLDETQINNLESAYAEVRARADICINTRKNRSTKNLLILWNPPIWYKMFVSSKGDLSEAYASYKLSDDLGDLFTSGNLEQLVEDFMVGELGSQHNGAEAAAQSRSAFNKFVNNVENMKGLNLTGVRGVNNSSGLFQGDVNINNTAYAIKSAGSSLVGYKQIVALAHTIQTRPYQSPSELIKTEALNQSFGYRNKMVNKRANAHLDELMDIIEIRTK